MFNKKEKLLFWSAAAIGLAFGTIGNLFASAIWQVISGWLGITHVPTNLGYAIVIILLSLTWIGFVIFAICKIRKNTPKRRRNS